MQDFEDTATITRGELLEAQYANRELKDQEASQGTYFPIQQRIEKTRGFLKRTI